MNTEEQIAAHISGHPEPKRSEMEELHRLILRAAQNGKLSFHDGLNSEGKVIANPTIGYGTYTIKYANGKTTESFRIGLSANKTGISVYILGLGDKAYLAQTYAPKLGKASVTGYCIRFKTLKDINIDVLETAVRYGIGQEE